MCATNLVDAAAELSGQVGERLGAKILVQGRGRAVDAFVLVDDLLNHVQLIFLDMVSRPRAASRLRLHPASSSERGRIDFVLDGGFQVADGWVGGTAG